MTFIPIGRLLVRGRTYDGAGDPLEEILLFEGALFGFELFCAGEGHEEVRVPGRMWPLEEGKDSIEDIRTAMREQAAHIEGCDCAQHELMSAEVIEYD